MSGAAAEVGRVLSWTRVHRAPSGFATPFVLALVETASGLVLATGGEEIGVGDDVLVERAGADAGAPPRFVKM